MCCNGVLFHSVRLQATDPIRKLAALGLRPKRQHVPQPCPAHQNSQCTIYADRPGRCREFNCQQLQGLEAGTINEARALETIGEAQRYLTRVQELFLQAKDSRLHKPIATRYAAIFTEPLDPSAEAVAVRKALKAAMRDLETHLAQNFRTSPAPSLGSEGI
jgi:uncharacterized protein